MYIDGVGARSMHARRLIQFISPPSFSPPLLPSRDESAHPDLLSSPSLSLPETKTRAVARIARFDLIT